MDIFVRILNPILMIGLGLGVGIWVFQRFRSPWSLYGIGVAGFVLSQVGHIPFNAYLLAPALRWAGWTSANTTATLLGVAAAYGLSSGIFEEVTRYLIFRFWRKDIRTWRLALMYGAGHGGSEAIILGFLALFAAIQMIAIRTTDLATLVPADQLSLAQSQVQAFWSAPWYEALLGALERLATIPVHLALSLLVLQVFKRNNLAWLLLAILAHSGVNALALVLMDQWGVYAAEAAILGCGLLAVFTIWRLREPLEEPASLPPVALSPLPSVIPEEELSKQSLEDSRYAE